MKYQCKDCSNVFSVISNDKISFAVCSRCGHEKLSQIAEKPIEKEKFVRLSCGCGQMVKWRENISPVRGDNCVCPHCHNLSEVSEVVEIIKR